MQHKKVLITKASSMKQSRVIPVAEAGLVPNENVTAPPPTSTKANEISDKGRRFSLDRVPVLLRARRYFARSRSSLQHENMQVHAFSLHGYSSLRMIQDGPPACKEKVNVIVQHCNLLLTKILKAINLCIFDFIYCCQCLRFCRLYASPG